MNIVITMAGLGSRFRKAGYKVPKYMIEAHGKTCFEWSMLSLAGLGDDTSKYIFIVRKEDGARGFIAQKCREFGINYYEVIEIDYLTRGQAATAMLASRYWDKSEELLIYNIDTYVEPYRMSCKETAWDGYIPCFSAPGDHWSFVRTDAGGRAIEVKEKTRISDNCTLGAYFFQSCELFETLYNEYYSLPEHMEKGEEYVAPLYNYLIQKGGTVYISTVDSENVHVLGTPGELKVFIDSYVPPAALLLDMQTRGTLT